MNNEELKIKLEEAGVSSDKISEVLDSILVDKNGNQLLDPIVGDDVVTQLQVELDNEKDALKKAALVARLISYKIDNNKY